MSTDDENPLADRMATLLKHAWLGIGGLTDPALEPYGIDGRSLAVLTVLAGPQPLSQLEAAQRLGVDRTTMVALIDGLEEKGLVTRSPHPADRRRNIVDLTAAGRETFRQATLAAADAERRFLAPLDAAEVARLRASLRKLNDAVASGAREPG